MIGRDASKTPNRILLAWETPRLRNIYEQAETTMISSNTNGRMSMKDGNFDGSVASSNNARRLQHRNNILDIRLTLLF